MPRPRNRSIKPAARSVRVTDHAREIAHVSDEWFVSLAGAVGRAGWWARREADIVADSAVAAFATTMGVAKTLTALAASGLVPAGMDAPRRAVAAEEDEASSPPEPELDLVCAVRPDEAL